MRRARVEHLAAHHGVSIETRLVTSDAIPGDSKEFDFIYGNGVLHHADIARARPELARILKPSGTACFIEPLTYNPVIDVYRRLAQTVRTTDERPLKFEDIEAFGQHFGSVEHREFWLLTLSVFLKFFAIDRAHPAKDRYWKKIYTDADRLAWFFGPLSRADDVLLKRLPPLRKLCWTLSRRLASFPENAVCKAISKAASRKKPNITRAVAGRRTNCPRALCQSATTRARIAAMPSRFIVGSIFAVYPE